MSEVSLRVIIPVDCELEGSLIDAEDEIKRYIRENIDDFLMDAWVEKE